MNYKVCSEILKKNECLDMHINVKNHVVCALAQDSMLLVLVLLLQNQMATIFFG